MVKTINIQLTSHQHYLTSARAPMVPKEPHAYPSRKPTLNPKAVDSYLATLDTLCGQRWEPQEYLRLTSHVESFIKALNAFTGDNPPARYSTPFPGITKDDAFVLEAAGLMGAVKYYQQYYEISKHFPALLAFLVGSNPETLEENLRQNCKVFKCDFDNLCRAFCSMDPMLLSSVDVKCFNGLSTQLDQIITLCTQFPNKCIFDWGEGYLDLRDPDILPQQRFTQFLLFQTAALTQHIFDEIIKDYISETNRTCMLVSKTTSTLIIQGNRAELRPSFEVVLGDFSFVLDPTLIKSGNYINMYIKGSI